jgi:hypothetical protein
MDITSFKAETKSYIKYSMMEFIDKYMIQKVLTTTFYGSILTMIGFNLIKWFITKPFNKEYKRYIHIIPTLVKINILETNYATQLRKIRNEMKKLRKDTLLQSWVGRFDYIYLNAKISGTVQITNSEVFTVSQNTDWLFNDSSNINHIVAYLSKYKVLEIPTWNGKMRCKIEFDDDSKSNLYLLLPQDILLEKNSHHIKWEKKLLAL